jgi:hypothetical protein
VHWPGFRGPEAGSGQSPRAKLRAQTSAGLIFKKRNGDLQELFERASAGHAADEVLVDVRDVAAADQLDELCDIRMNAPFPHVRFYRRCVRPSLSAGSVAP